MEVGFALRSAKAGAQPARPPNPEANAGTETTCHRLNGYRGSVAEAHKVLDPLEAQRRGEQTKRKADPEKLPRSPDLPAKRLKERQHPGLLSDAQPS